jgi:hypothetical protein
MQAAARIGQKRHLKDKNKATKTCREKEIQNQNKNQSFPKETPVSKIVLLCRSSLVSLCLAGRAETNCEKKEIADRERG